MNSPSGTNLAHLNSAAPIIVDLGKIGRKKVRKLKKGQGPYINEVQGAIAQVRASLTEDAAGKEILPIVVLYEQKPKKRKFPMLNLLS